MATNFETRLNRLEQKVNAINRDSNGDRNLREGGLNKGSKGVAAAFVLIGGIFLGNVAFKLWGPGGELFTFEQFIYLTIVVIVGLLFYFAFIFGYNMYVDYQAGKMGADKTGAANGKTT